MAPATDLPVPTGTALRTPGPRTTGLRSAGPKTGGPRTAGGELYFMLLLKYHIFTCHNDRATFVQCLSSERINNCTTFYILIRLLPGFHLLLAYRLGEINENLHLITMTV